MRGNDHPAQHFSNSDDTGIGMEEPPAVAIVILNWNYGSLKIL